MDQKNLSGNGRFPNAIKRCGERYIHCIEDIVPRHAWGVGRVGRLAEIDYRQLDMHSMCSLTGGSTVASYVKYVKKA